MGYYIYKSKGFECKLTVDSNCDKEIFSIKKLNNEKNLIDFVSPFETANDAIQNEDNRVIILERLLRSLNNENQNNTMNSL